MDNLNTSTSVRNASRTITYGPEEDKKREAYIFQGDEFRKREREHEKRNAIFANLRIFYDYSNDYNV